MVCANSLKTLIGLLLLCLQFVPALAASSTFVSAATGNNANSCGRTDPCRTLARALRRTSPGGEIKVLDPGDYGSVIIDQSVHIVSEGPGEAAILVASGETAITINAGASDVVSLRGITIKGLGAGAGILFSSGATLTVERCVVRDLNGTGIHFQPNASASLVVANSIVTNVGGRGIYVNPAGGASGTFSAMVSRSEVHGTTELGIFAHGTGSSGAINMTVSDSVSTGNPGSGIRANSLAGATTTLTVTRSVSANNGKGITAANGNAIVRVGQSTISGNNSGWVPENGGTLQSYGDNYVDGNGTNQGAMPLVGRK